MPRYHTWLEFVKAFQCIFQIVIKQDSYNQIKKCFDISIYTLAFLINIQTIKPGKLRI